MKPCFLVRSFNFLTFIFLLFSFSIFAHDFEDLKEGEEKVYGSKKREKYRSTAFFWEIEDWEGHYSETIFWAYNHTNYPKYKSTYFFPFYEKIESKIDDRKKERFINYISSNKGSETENSFFPLAFWGNDSIEKTDYFTLLPLFHVGFQNKPNQQAFRLIVPLIFYDELKTKNEAGIETEEREFVLLPMYRKYSKISNENDFTSYSFPVLPLIYYSKENKERHVNLFWIFDSTWKDGNLSKNFLFPLYYYHSEPEISSSFFLSPLFYRHKTKDFHYQHYLSTLYTWEHASSKGWNLLGLVHSERDHENLKTHYAMPFYYYEENDRFVSLLYSRFLSGGGKHRFGFGPFYIFWDNPGTSGLWAFNYFSEKSKDNNKKKLLFFPIFDYEKNSSDSSFSLFYLFSRKYTEEKVSYSRLFPFYSYEKNEKRDEYSFLLGLIGRHYSEKGDLVYSRFFPFYAYEKPDKTFGKYSGFFGLYGKEFDDKGETVHSRFLPFYNYNRDESLFAGLYYRKGRDDLAGGFFRTLFPVYYAWKTPESESSNLLPLWIDYKSIRGEEYKINILGIARTQQSGFLRPDLDVGKKGDRFYLDTDLSWFHSLFRISSRVSAKNPFYNIPKEFYDPEKDELPPEADQKPGLSKKKSFTREDSNFFIGYSALFYLFSYERADTKRHFRTFPLMWITWDEKSDEKLILFPPILPLAFYYNTPELQYMAVIPFFGRQKTEESKIDSILLFGYIGEEYKEKNLKETSILWPIFNRYKADEESGFRIFPLFWDKWFKKSEISTHRNFSPIHFFQNDKSEKFSESTYLTFPIYHNHYQSADRNRFTWFFPIFYYFKESYKNQEYKRDESQVTTWSLLHYFESDIMYMDGQKKEGKMSWVTPLWISGQVYQNSEKPVEEYNLYPFFFTSREKDENYWNFSFLLRRTKSEKETKIGFGPLFDLIGYEGLEKQKLEDSKIWFIPIFYRYKEEASLGENTKYRSTLNYFFPFIFKTTNESISENSSVPSWKGSTLFTLLYSYDESWSQDGRVDTTRFIPFPLMLYTRSNPELESWRTFFFISSKKNSKEKTSEFSIWPIAPIFYNYESPSTSHTNLFGVLFDKKREENYKRFYLFPYWESQEGSDRFYRHIIPFYFSSYGAKDHSFFFLGLYRENFEVLDYWNFLFLGIYDRDKQNKNTSLSFLFGGLQFNSSPDKFHSSLLYGLLYDIDVKGGEYSKYRGLWMYYHKPNEKDKDINLFPFFGMERFNENLSLSFYPLLSFYDDTPELTKSMLGFGALYYRKQYKTREERYTSVLATLLYEHDVYVNPSGRVEERSILPLGLLYHRKTIDGVEKTEDQSILWGSVYLKERKAENDYHRHGSLWGFLWQYEYEEKTDYRKFSILKIFSKEVYQGKTRIMGILID